MTAPFHPVAADPNDPGQTLRALRLRYAPSATEAGEADATPALPDVPSTTAGDALHRLAESVSSPRSGHVGDIDLRGPETHTAGSSPAARDILALTPVVPVDDPTVQSRVRAALSSLSAGQNRSENRNTAPSMPGVPSAIAEATRVGPEQSSAHYEPGALERILTFPLSMAFGAAQHPVDFAAAPLKALYTAALAPSIGENRPDPRLSKGGNSSGRAIDTTPYDAEHGGVTQKERAIGAAQVAAAALAPTIAGATTRAVAPVIGEAAGHLAGHALASGTAGAAFMPDDPVVGFFGGALMAMPTPEAVSVVRRATDAGRTRVAQLVEAARSAEQQARSLGAAEARGQFNAIVARTLPTLDAADIAHIQDDPTLGPLSREAFQRAGIKSPATPDLTAARNELARSAQVEPDVPVADALRPSPSIESRRVAPSDQAAVESEVRKRARFFGHDEQEAVQLYRDELVGRTPSTEPPRVSGTDVPVTGDVLQRQAASGVAAQDAMLEHAEQLGYTPERMQANREANAASHASFPINADDVVGHAETKGFGLTPEGVERSAAALRGAGYAVTDDMVREAKATASRYARVEPASGLPARDAFGNLVESFDDQRNRMIEETRRESEARRQAPSNSTSFRDALGMDAETLARVAEETAKREKNVEQDLFGAEGARRYAAAQATLNSQYGHLNAERYAAAQRTVDDMESALSESDRNRLFGIGQVGLSGDELRDAARWAHTYSPAGGVGEMAIGDLYSTVGRELTTGQPHRDPVSAVRLRGAVEELQRRTAQPLEQIVADGLSERVTRDYATPAQVTELVRARIADLRNAGLFTEEVRPNAPQRTALPPSTIAREGNSGRVLEARAPFAGGAAEGRDLFAKVPPAERNSTGGAPTRAGALLREARSPSEAPTSAGPVLGNAPDASTPDIAVRGVNKYADAFRKIFNPTARGPEALQTGLATREGAARLAHQYERAKEALREFGRAMDRLPVAQQLDFIDRMETGRAQETPELTRAAATIRDLLDHARDDIRALGDGQLDHWIENYFPHIWADPEKARSVIASIVGNRSMAGPGTFLKRRSIPTVRDGVEAGLVPVTYNPVDLTLLKLQEMYRYLYGKRIIAELKDRGILRFVNSFEKAPDGYTLINDKLSTVYGPPRVTVVEAYDHFIRQGLEKVMRDLGITHTRKPKIGGGGGGTLLGFAEGATKITTRSATDLSVLQHELGHSLDARLGLWDRLQRYEPAAGEPTTKAAAQRYRATIGKELRALADLRHEGIEDPGPGQRAYVRKKEEKIANLVMGLLHAPERTREVAPTVEARLRSILASDPVTAQILDIKPSFRHEASAFDVPTDGRVILGHYYAPEPAARVLNNYLSPGLSTSAIGPYFNVYRQVGNLLNMAQLGMSAFHLGFTSLDAIVSRTALGVMQLREGQPVKAAATFAAAPLAPLTTAMKGREMKQAYLRGTDDPTLTRMVDALDRAGGRVAMDTFYSGGWWRQMQLAAHEGRYGAAAVRALPAAFEKAAAPIMEHIVPLQKLGVFYGLADHELAKLPPGADDMQVRQTLARAWDSVDNRLGQMVYDNLFWNRMTKDLAMASVRSVGWNLGTIREMVGGVGDLAHAPKQGFAITPRASYVIALPISVGMLGGIYTYLATGQAPQSLKDYFYPRTGRRNPDGSDERVQLPSYLRDVRDYAVDPLHTVKNKVNPAIPAIGEMLSNEDFYGNQIRNPDAPIVRQLAQEAEAMAARFLPLGVRTAVAQRERGQSIGQAAQNFIGITPAPRDVLRSRAERRMAELLARRGAGGSLTPEQAEHSAELRTLRNNVRDGRTPPADALRSLAEQYASGAVTRVQARRVVRDASMSGAEAQFKRLTLEEALEVYQIGTPEERRAWRPFLHAKVLNAQRSGHAVALPTSVLQP